MLLIVRGSVRPICLATTLRFLLKHPLIYMPGRTYRNGRDVRKFHRRLRQGVPSQRDGPVAVDPGGDRSDESAGGESYRQVEPSKGRNARRGHQYGICGVLCWCPWDERLRRFQTCRTRPYEMCRFVAPPPLTMTMKGGCCR